MNHGQDFVVWIQDWELHENSMKQIPVSHGILSGKFRAIIDSVPKILKIGLEYGSELMQNIYKSLKYCCNIMPEDLDSLKGIINPDGQFLHRWNKIFLLLCVIAISLDPLFFYIFVISDDKKCIGLDRKMVITASVLRSITDMFYILHIIFQFRTGYFAPSSTFAVFGRYYSVQDSRKIAWRYLSTYFVNDILAILPLPQVVILFIGPKMRSMRSLRTVTLLNFIVYFQYGPRLFRIYSRSKEVRRTSGILTESAWAGAALNLFLYILASHVLGAFWYSFSIQRVTTYWQEVCGKHTGCKPSYIYCDDHAGYNTFLNGSCPIKTPNSTLFDFGIFEDALKSGVVESTGSPQKFFYCFWWGLRNLSSLGQNLETSTYIWEIIYAVFISISGLVLFSFFIGNMQRYLHSGTTRLEEMRVTKKQDAELWMSHRTLPRNIRERIRRYEQYKWQQTRGVDEENLLSNLPKDLRRDIKRHLCLDLLKRVPMFDKMDEQLLDAMCYRLKPVLFTEDTYIVREGDPVDEMIFIMRGTLLTFTTNGGRAGFLNTVNLKAGDFCGEELLTWALDPHSLSHVPPTSTRTVRALSEVEAFALMVDDLINVASQFRHLHSRQIQHTFRFYSLQWRTWAACFIQAAWRRYAIKKLLQDNNSLQCIG